MLLSLVTARTLRLAAMRRHASSSVAPVPSRYERSLRPSLACISRPAVTICNEGEQ